MRSDTTRQQQEYRENDTSSAISALVAVNIVIIETLDRQGLVDRKHFAIAIAKALDNLDADLTTPAFVRTLEILKLAFMGSADRSEVAATIQRLTNGRPAS